MVKPRLPLIALLMGGALTVLGMFGSAAAVFGILDPVGAKMADDGDPFGLPPTVGESLTLLGAYLALAAVGGFIAWFAFRRMRTTHLTKRCS